MKILITGAAGFIGSAMARALVARGDDVVGLDNFSDYYPRKAKEFNLELTRKVQVGRKRGREYYSKRAEVDPVFEILNSYYSWDQAQNPGEFSFYEVDIRDREGLANVFESAKPDKVVHLAAMAGVSLSVTEPHLYNDVNVLGSINVLDMCKQFGVDRLVFGSSSSVYGARNDTPFREDDDVDMPMSPYAATKRMIEIENYTYHKLFDINIVNARIFGPIYGPLQRPFRMVAQRFINYTYNGKPMPIFGDGKQGGRDTTFIDDEVDGLILALDSEIEFDTINIGSGRVVTPQEVADNVISIMGKGTVDYIERHASEVPITYADTAKAKTLLNFDAKWQFTDGLKRQIEVFLAMPDWYKRLNS